MKNNYRDKIFKLNGLNFLAVAIKLSTYFLCAGMFVVLSGCGYKNILRENAPSNSVTNPIEKKENESVETKPVKILFVGDMMFDRYIRQAVEKHGGDYDYIFSDIKNDLAKYDLVVANLEGPITTEKSVSVGTAMDEKNNFKFTFDPVVGQAFADNNIKLVNLGNNHIFNQKEDGLSQTKKYLTLAGIQYFGDTGSTNDVIASEAKQSRESEGGTGSPRPFGARDDTLIKNIAGTKIGFVNYNYSVASSFERSIEEIKNVRSQSDIVIVYPHWGTEYKTGDPSQKIKNMARQFIDAGADLVIGTHPHVVQVNETYQGKKIYYSLGNFVFDQYFSLETMRGLVVEVEINPGDHGMKFLEIPVKMEKNGKTVIR